MDFFERRGFSIEDSLYLSNIPLHRGLPANTPAGTDRGVGTSKQSQGGWGTFNLNFLHLGH